VSKVDPNNTTACFGLSRCLKSRKDIIGAANALNLVPVNHSLYIQSRISLAKVLMFEEDKITENILDQLAQTVGSITLKGGVVHELTAKVLTNAIKLIHTNQIKENKNSNLLGYKLQEYQLRLGAEAEYRKAARYSTTAKEKIEWINLANAIRPVTLF
jgi:serine/threonine-protein kinase PknG